MWSKLFKRLFIVFFFLFLVLPAFAEIRLLTPLERAVQNNENIRLGEMQPGETFELIIDKDTENFKWTSLKVNTETFPFGWKTKLKSEDQSFSFFISIPADSEEKTQNIHFILSNPRFQESFDALLVVRKNLVNASIQNLKQETTVDKKVSYKLLLTNNSIARHIVSVKSSLPEYWFSKESIELNPKEKKEVMLFLNPKVYGERFFEFFIVSELNNQVFNAIGSELVVYPTIRGKYSAALTGFPILTPGLLPFYLINSFLALFG